MTHWSHDMSAAPRDPRQYLIDGSGCEACNFTGSFGGWIAGKWHGYPQIKCDKCGPISTALDAAATEAINHLGLVAD